MHGRRNIMNEKIVQVMNNDRKLALENNKEILRRLQELLGISQK